MTDTYSCWDVIGEPILALYGDIIIDSLTIICQVFGNNTENITVLPKLTLNSKMHLYYDLLKSILRQNINQILGQKMGILNADVTHTHTKELWYILLLEASRYHLR